MTDQEVFDSVLSNYCAEEEEEKDEESEVNYIPLEKSKLSDVAGAIELFECWSLFENSGGETGSQSLNVISKKFDKLSLETKRQSKMHYFFKKL